LTYELANNHVKVNQHAKFLGHGSFRSAVIVKTDRRLHLYHAQKYSAKVKVIVCISSLESLQSLGVRPRLVGVQASADLRDAASAAEMDWAVVTDVASACRETPATVWHFPLVLKDG